MSAGSGYNNYLKGIFIGGILLLLVLPGAVSAAKEKITGCKFNDLNENGAYDPGEPNLSGWAVELLGTNTKVTTGANGCYQISKEITPGTYVLQEVSQEGWLQKFPSGGTYSITIAEGSVITGKNFGNYEIPDSCDIGVIVPGNPKCDEMECGGARLEVQNVTPDIDPLNPPNPVPNPRTVYFPDGISTVTLTYFDNDGDAEGLYEEAYWESTIPVNIVVAKGDRDSCVENYAFVQDSCDEGAAQHSGTIRAPFNPKTGFHSEISKVDFCYDPDDLVQVSIVPEFPTVSVSFAILIGLALVVLTIRPRKG